ncbi:MAG: hypothetical protein PSV40_20465 [Polaromonas sp.]|uniref:hypothetical protein n=1 Tax=Polaromonas sp. TaxID=1869339 RepID=UPI0024873E0A|nr:hypothetical protein [Polaromonas sp.]MDI1271468.1 hypothetical protein [Polaromonas sp.]
MGSGVGEGVNRATSWPRRVMQKASPRSTAAMSLEKFWLASRSEISWNVMGKVGRKVIDRGYLFVQMIFVNVVQIVVHEY